MLLTADPDTPEDPDKAIRKVSLLFPDERKLPKMSFAVIVKMAANPAVAMLRASPTPSVTTQSDEHKRAGDTNMGKGLPET